MRAAPVQTPCRGEEGGGWGRMGGEGLEDGSSMVGWTVFLFISIILKFFIKFLKSGGAGSCRRLGVLSASPASHPIPQAGHTCFSRLAMAGYLNRILLHSALLSATKDAHCLRLPGLHPWCCAPFVGGMRRCSLLRCGDSVSFGCGREPLWAEPLWQNMDCIVSNKVWSNHYYWVLWPEPCRTQLAIFFFSFHNARCSLSSIQII